MGLPIVTSQLRTKKKNLKPSTIAPCQHAHATKSSNQYIHIHMQNASHHLLFAQNLTVVNVYSCLTVFVSF